MRIAHVSDCYEPRLGGIECQVRELARRQRQQGDRVTVITCVAGPASEDGLEVVRPPAFRQESSTSIRYWWSPHQLKVLADGSFDVVHVHLSTFSPLAFAAARASARRGIPTVVTVHSLLTGWTAAYRALAALAGSRGWPVRWSAVSTVAARSLHAVLRQGATVEVVPNGIDASAWTTDRAGADDGSVRIVSVGRLALRKRPLPLVRILQRARELTPAHVQLSAVLVGDGPQRAAVDRDARRRDIDWLGLPGALARDKIRSVHAASDIYVAPATRESFGIAALEARCAGLPVIALGRTGIRDFIQHDVHGLLVDDDHAMARAIAHLAKRPEELRRLTDHVRSTPSDVTWERVMDAWDELYGRPRGAEVGLAARSRAAP